ncbi:MAG: type II secretion system protein [Alphaproteobacteria bacterium]|nr:type II secretion system protein [Alphaproteobacteria bacterium]
MFNKHTCNHTQNGRSMLEMLAVLGLVAILTLTALFGYRYAMASAKSQRAFKDVMLRSAAIASSATFETEANGIIDPPMGFAKTSGGLKFDHYKADANSYSIAVSDFNQLACQKLLDMDYQETPVKGIALNDEKGYVSVESMDNKKMAEACLEADNKVVYYFDRALGLAGRGIGGGGDGGGTIIGSCSTSSCRKLKVCEVALDKDKCGCPLKVRWADKGTRCYENGECDGAGKCICLPGYYLEGEKCLPCPANTYSNGGNGGPEQCLPCPSNAHSPAGSAVCICDDPTSVWDPKTNTCAAACSTDSDCSEPYPDCYKENGSATGLCICKGFHGPNSCIRCNESAGATWEKIKARWKNYHLTGCTCTDANKIWHQSNNCKCKADTYWDGTKCNPCGAGSSRPDWTSADVCICDDESQTWDSQTNTCKGAGKPCSSDADCDEPYPDCYKDANEATGYCICKGFHGPNSCIRCNESAGATWEKIKAKWLAKLLTGCTCKAPGKIWHQSNNCKCDVNTYWDGAKCNPCGPGSSRPDWTSADVCICDDESQTWNPKTNSCGETCSSDADCAEPYPDCYKEEGAATGQCICKGFHGPDSCIRCNETAGSVWEKIRERWKTSRLTGCTCTDPGKIWHQSNNCKCDIDTYWDGAKCNPCGEGSSRPDWTSADVCICDDETQVWDPKTNTCQANQFCETDDDCTDPAYPTCYQIPEGDKMCVCLGWHDEQGATCLKCDAKKGAKVPEPWDKWLFKPRMSGCVCPLHSQFVDGTCVCDEGYVWNDTTKQCDPAGIRGKGCTDKAFLDVVCDGEPSVSGKAGDAVITVKYCAVGTTPGNDGKGLIRGTFKMIEMHRQHQKNGGEFYAGATPTNWYDTQIICNVMKQADSSFKMPSNTEIRRRKGCKHPRRIRSALKNANSYLSGPNTPRRVWESNTAPEGGQCMIDTHDVRSGVIQNEYKIRKLNAIEDRFVAGTWVVKAGGKKIFVDGGMLYPLCYHNIAAVHCDDDAISDDPE